MSVRRASPHLAATRWCVLTALMLCAVRAHAQSPAAQPPEHQHPAPDAQHDHTQMTHAEHAATIRDASGTAWQPVETPMFARHGEAGPWRLMLHGNLFVQYLHDEGPRGREQTGSINWAMAMASRAAGGGRLDLHGMISLEPWTIGGCGYPDLLASGEVCDGESIHDLQHPHDFVMELAASYSRPLGRVSWQVYGGVAGEPALGPVAFPHRLSAQANPVAPITHHWFDSTHVTYGVVTGGFFGDAWKVESSIFNGREPDEDRHNLDLAALDSWAARAWFLPTPRWALQISAGHLTEAETGHDIGERTDVDRVTASATYHRPQGPGSFWASTMGWGRNAEEGAAASSALLFETKVMRRDRHVFFGRAEVSEKSGHDLDFDLEEIATVGKVQAGYTRYFAFRGWQPGVGAVLSLSIVPESLNAVYGGRTSAGFGAFVTLRPARSE